MLNQIRSRASWPQPWLFGVLYLTTGVYSGFLSTAVPFFLRKLGMHVEDIAAISATALSPTVWGVALAPLVTIWFRKRAWLVIAAGLSAASIYLALQQPLPQRVTAFTGLLTFGNAAGMLISAAVGGLVADTVPDRLRGRTAGWIEAAFLGGGALGAAVSLWIEQHTSMAWSAAATAFLIFVPALPALTITEELPASAENLWEPFRRLAREIWEQLRRKRTVEGLLLFGLPLAAGAAKELFSGIATDYQASAGVVIWVTGLGGAVVTAAGALAGGFVCDRMSRKYAYLLAGLLSGLAAAGMASGPFNRVTYSAGCLAYLLVTGFGFAAFVALSFEIIGTETRSASTLYTLFIAFSNIPLTFMTWLDGVGYSHFGPRGLLGTDAIANVAAVAVGAIFIRYVFIRQRSSALECRTFGST